VVFDRDTVKMYRVDRLTDRNEWIFHGIEAQNTNIDMAERPCRDRVQCVHAVGNCSQGWRVHARRTHISARRATGVWLKLAALGENWLVRAPGTVERIEACFSGAAFTPHRHDTYAIGVTLEGVQSFDYRGSTRYSLPGQLVVLHPDELHDGRAGDDRAFRYRTAYIPPVLVQSVLGGRPLPFVEGGVSSDPRLRNPVWGLIEDYDRPLGGLELQDALYDLVAALQAVTGNVASIKVANRAAVLKAREYIDARIAHSFTLGDLERVTRHDRWQLSRDFRTLLGTSPYRYLTLRRLDKARRMLLAGCKPTEAAIDCGFSDQSHLCRIFKKNFGMTPKSWIRAIRSTHDHSRPAKDLLPN
jgi:AraC-like DNA-binding protein